MADKTSPTPVAPAGTAESEKLAGLARRVARIELMLGVASDATFDDMSDDERASAMGGPVAPRHPGKQP